MESQPGQTTSCWSTADTCKSVTTYAPGFKNFPDTKVSCVAKSTDNPYGCSDCTNSSCTFFTYDSLTEIVVKTKCDANTNIPQVTSCFNGTLTVASQKTAPCIPSAVYCQVNIKSFLSQIKASILNIKISFC